MSIVINNADFTKWENITETIKDFYNKLIECKKNNNINGINYYTNSIINAKRFESSFIEYLALKYKQEDIFSFILSHTDYKVLTRMYKNFEPILIKTEKYTGKKDLMSIIEFQKKKNDYIKKGETSDLIALNSAFVISYLAPMLEDNSIDLIYNIAFINPNIEDQILSNVLFNIQLDKEDPYYEENRSHLLNIITSILLQESENKNMEEVDHVTNIIDLVTYLTAINEPLVLYDVENNILNINNKNRNHLLIAVNEAKKILGMNEKVRK